MGTQDSNFKKLQSHYYQKLKDSGFVDIENETNPNWDLKTHRGQDFSLRIGFKTGLFEEIRDYYDWACEALHLFQFKTPRDEQIWRLHSEGLAARQIAVEVKLDQTWVSREIIKIRNAIKASK